MYQKELYIAQLAVKRASLLTRQISQQIRANTIVKSDDSPVTLGDFAAQAIIINSIRKNFPNDEVVGEEDSTTLRENKTLLNNVFQVIKDIQSQDLEFNDIIGELTTTQEVTETIDHGNSKGGSKGRIWALDPIDGTKGFIRGDQFAVCLALIEDGKVKLGVIGCPHLKSHVSSEVGGLFSAVQNYGSHYQDLSKPVTTDFQNSIKISMRNIDIHNPDLKICEGVEKGHSSHDLQSNIKAKLGITEESQTVRFDSQVKYCALARGDAEIYLRLPKSMSYEEKIWDHAAGNILITESGGIVSDMYGNTLNFGEGRTLKSKGIIAATSLLHKDVIEAVSLCL